MDISKLEAGALYTHLAKDHDPRHAELKERLEKNLEWVTITVPGRFEHNKIPFYFWMDNTLKEISCRVFVTQQGRNYDKERDTTTTLKGFLTL